MKHLFILISLFGSLAFAQNVIEKAEEECRKIQNWYYEVSAEKKPSNVRNNPLVYHPRPRKTKQVVFKTYEECKSAMSSDKKSLDDDCKPKHVGPDLTVTLFKSDFVVNNNGKPETHSLFFSSKEICEKHQINGTKRQFLQTVSADLKVYPKTSSETTRYDGECTEKVVRICSEQRMPFLGDYHEIIE